jgi:hypothetical protein
LGRDDDGVRVRSLSLNEKTNTKFSPKKTGVSCRKDNRFSVLVRLKHGSSDGVWVSLGKARELQQNGQVHYVLDMKNIDILVGLEQREDLSNITSE